MKSRETAKVLFLAYQGLVARVAVRHAPSPSLVEDVVQQVFLEFVSKADSLDLETDVRSLLAAMSRNIARRYWREELRKHSDKQRELAEHVRQMISRDDPEKDDGEIETNLREMKNCLEKMPEKTKELVELHYFQQIPIKELGELLGLNSETVYRAIYRVRHKLKRCIEFALKKRGAHA